MKLIGVICIASSCGLGLAFSVGLVSPARADVGAPPATTEASSLEEIVVTAQRREERLVDVPLPVTAITAGEIEARGVTSLQDIQYSVPGLTMSEFGPGQGRLQLDGISTAGGATGLPTVGRYLDEMPITADGAGSELDLRLIDMQRVEVLHGPQPTLYGEGSMGGTIHFVTAPVDLSRFTGFLQGSWGSVTHGSDSYNGVGVLNAPIIDGVFGVRISAGYERIGGWIDAPKLGATDYNGVDIKTVRLKALFQPISDFSVSLMYLHQEHNQDSQNYADEDTRITGAVLPSPNSEKYDIANLIVTYNFGSVTLLSSTGLIHREPIAGFDQSAYFAPLFQSIGFPNIDKVGEYTSGTQNMLSQELRISSNGGTPFNYTAGLYGRNYRTGVATDFTTAPGSLPFAIDTDNSSSQSKSWAAYGELRYAFTPAFEGLLGLRHFEDERTLNDAFSSFGTSASSAQEAKFGTTNPRFNLSYKTSSAGIVYLDVAKGFRSGGFNSQAGGSVPPTYGPETLWTYTIGAKQDWLERRLSVDISAYYNNWTDIQVVGVNGAIANSYSSNTGKASGPGVNFALSARPIPELTFAATMGYTDMKYDTASSVVDKGDPLDMVTKWTYSASADFRRPITADVAFVSRLDYSHTSGYQLTLRDTPFNAINPTGSFDLLNVRVGADFGRWQAYVFAHNLADRKGEIYPAVGSLPEPVVTTPRTVGVEARIDF